MKKILLLGASSTIGSNILLEDKSNLIDGQIRKPIKLHSKIKIKRLNLNKKKIIYTKLKNIENIKTYDVVINCIGLTKNYNNKKFNIRLNKKKFLKYSKYILDIINKSKCKIFIHFGSSLEYAGLKNCSIKKLHEKSKTLPCTAYGKYKVFENKFFEKKLKKKKIKYVHLRIFSVYGNLLKKDSLIYSLLLTKNKIKNPYKLVDIISCKYLLKIIFTIIKKINSFKKKNIIINCTSNSPVKIYEIMRLFKIKKKIFFKESFNELQYIGSSEIIKKKLKINSFNILNNCNKFIYRKNFI
jgi:nucleoside-diphosphate-sugar epimerase